MATLFIILLVLAFIHFIYEGILLPSFRCKYRYDLFRLRDELRNLKFEYKDEISNEVYTHVQDGINTSLKYLHAISVVEAFRALRIIANDTNLHSRMIYLAGIINVCPIKRVRDIDDESIEILAKVALLNSGGMLVYVVPIAAFYFWGADIRKRLGQFVKAIFSASENQRNQFIPAVPA